MIEKPWGWKVLKEGDDGFAASRPCVSLPTIVRAECVYSQDTLRIIASWGGGWDHVSVSLASGALPGWHIMKYVHKQCFGDTMAIQYFMPEQEHVDYSAAGLEILHLWRPQNISLPIPPKIFV